jgi:mRNA interferase RelE/StbE
MSYAVRIKQSALRAMDRLPKQDRSKVDDRIRTLSNSPRPPGCLKLAVQENLWRIRVGDYRVVYEIRDKEFDRAGGERRPSPRGLSGALNNCGGRWCCNGAAETDPSALIRRVRRFGGSMPDCKSQDLWISRHRRFRVWNRFVS